MYPHDYISLHVCDSGFRVGQARRTKPSVRGNCLSLNMLNNYRALANIKEKHMTISIQVHNGINTCWEPMYCPHPL